MRWIEIIFPAGCLLLTLSMLVLGLGIYDYDFAVMNFPIFVCVLTMIFSLMVLYQNWPSGVNEAPLIAGWARNVLILSTSIPALLLFGLEVGLSLFLLSYLIVHKRGLLLSLCLSFACFLLIYGVFEFYFHIPHFQALLLIP